VEGYTRVEDQSWVGGVEEAFFFVGLEGENCEPEVEGGGEDYSSQVGGSQWGGAAEVVVI